jgi:hypothetical protein
MTATLVLFFTAQEARKLVDRFLKLSPIETSDSAEHPQRMNYIFGLISLYCIFQLLFPFRHFLYEGNMFWTSEGKLCSWHMMSGDKNTKCSKVFTLLDSDKKSKMINNKYDIHLTDYLNVKQIRTLGVWPYLIPQFMDYLVEQAKLEGIDNIEIYGDIMVTRNNRPLKHIVGPITDLTKLESKEFGHNNWILLYSEEGF